jgi:hypothetical protein
MIHFTELTQDTTVHLNGNKLGQCFTCEYLGATWVFTSRAGARAWAEDVVFQRHNLPRLNADTRADEGGWRDYEAGRESW